MREQVMRQTPQNSPKTKKVSENTAKTLLPDAKLVQKHNYSIPDMQQLQRRLDIIDTSTLDYHRLSNIKGTPNV